MQKILNRPYVFATLFTLSGLGYCVSGVDSNRDPSDDFKGKKQSSGVEQTQIQPVVDETKDEDGIRTVADETKDENGIRTVADETKDEDFFKKFDERSEMCKNIKSEIKKLKDTILEEDDELFFDYRKAGTQSSIKEKKLCDRVRQLHKDLCTLTNKLKIVRLQEMVREVFNAERNNKISGQNAIETMSIIDRAIEMIRLLPWNNGCENMIIRLEGIKDSIKNNFPQKEVSSSGTEKK